MVLLTSSNLWYRYFFKGESLVFFFMRKALKTYMHDLGYKLLARKWIHILTTLGYNHNLQYTYKRDMDAVLQLSKRRKFCLKLDISEYQPLFINGGIAINIQKLQVFVMLKNDSFQFVGASKLIWRHYFSSKNGKIKTAKFLDRKIYMKNNTFTSTFNM